MRRSFLLAVALVGLAFAPHAGAQDPGALRPVIAARYPDVAWVDAPTLAQWLAAPSSQRPLLLDARTEAEFAVSHLEGARRIDPEHPDLAALGPPTNRRVVVYCSVGWRSAYIADVLQRAGYRRVFNLEGGIFGWANADRPVVDAHGPTHRVHPYDAVWGRLLRADLRSPLH